MKQASTISKSTSSTSNSPFQQQKGNGSPVSENNPPFFSGPVVQNKLTVGAPNDVYEKEADAVADQLVQRLKEPMADASASQNSAPAIQAKCASCEQEEQVQQKEEITEEGKEKLQTKAIFESNEEPVQTKALGTGMVQAKCAACEEEEQVQTKSNENAAIEASSITGVQAKLSIGQPGDPYEREADAVADKVVQRSMAEGPTVQAKVEPVIGSITPLLQSKAAINEKLQEKKEDNEKEITEELQKKPIADTAVRGDTIQRYCRECEEGLIFRKATGMVQRAEDAPGDGSRESIVAAAKAELGKVEAKRDDGSGKRIGADRLLEYFHIAAPGVWQDSDIENAGGAIPAWCGIFSVYAHKKAGKDIGTWQMGTGVTAFNTLEATDDPQPGDIGYIHEPYRHHCIIKEINGDTVISIDGNSGAFSEVIENTRSFSDYDGFFTAFGGGGSSVSVQRKEEKDEPLQTKPAAAACSASAGLEQQLSASKGAGSSMPDNVRGSMEQNFGADFSNVRIHTDTSAVQMSKDLHAQAFTHGSDIYFNNGKYDPQSSSGKHLLAHELTHTIQQGHVQASGTVQKQGATSGTPPTTAKYIVEDAATPTANQLRKTDFLTRLNQDICRITDEVLIGTPFTSQTCPYISRGFQRLREKTPLEIETLLSRYERQLLTAETLQQYFEIIGNRVRTATTNWLQNGDLSGIPEEIAAQIPEHMRALAGIAGRVSGVIGTVTSGLSSLASGAEDVLSRIGNFFFKSKNGNARATQSPVSVMQNLGKGTTLEGSSRNKMESAFGSSFSNVAIHTDSKASQMASDMNARAFTLGNHIAFGSGEYRPGTLTGDALMAHELAHVQQQKGSPAATMTKSSATDNQPLETEADDTAVNVVTQIWGKSKGATADLSKKASPKLKTGLQLQRCSTPAGPEWDGNVSALRIDLFVTNGISEQPVDPGEAITRDFPSFVARLNYWGHRLPRVMDYRVYNANGELQFPPRVPAERGVSRIPMLPVGAYRIVGAVATGQSGVGVVQVERNIRILDPLKDVAATQAPGDLGRQAGHTLQGDLIGFEQFAAVLRQNAVAVAGVSQELVDAWNAAHAQAVVIEGSINRAIDAGVHASAKTAIINFYRQLRSIVGGSDVYHPERTETEHDGLARSTSTFPAYTTNPYITQERTEENIRRMNAGGSGAADWRAYLNTFYEVTNLLNTYIADRLQAAGFTESATQLRNSGAYSTHLRQLYRDHPDAKPVQAVFYPKLQAGLRNDAAEGEAPHFTLTGLPQKMYSYRAGDGVWHLLDVTRPSRPFDSFASGGSATVPPRELITGLDNPERFPEGVMHWQFDGGAADSCEMTHPWTPSDVLNFISAILALAGIAALVVASGGVAIPALVPTLLFVASGVVGAVAASEHMRESTELGTLTEQTVVMDSMAIAVNLLSAVTAGAGHIVRAARAAEVAYTGWRAGAALAAQTVLRPLQIATIGGDLATIITFTAQAAQQYTQIENMPPGEARTFALQRLVAMSLLTGGMTLMSLKGGLHDLGAGRTLYLDYTTIGDARRWVAHRVMPEGDLLAHTRLTGVRTEAEAVLARTDLDAGTLDQFRGELSVTLGTPGIAREEIENFVRRMRTAGTPDEARRILVNFRESRVGVTVGGVSRNAGYDLTYFHTSPTDFHTSVRQAFDGEGHVVHNGRLTHVEGGDVSSYRLSVDTPSGARVEADVEIVYQNFSEGSAVGTGTVTPGSGSGPARNTIRWDAEAGKWRVRVEVDQRLAPRDIRRAVGHELDEAGDVINRLHGTTGDINAQIRQLVAPNLFGTGPLSSHDIATLRELDHLLAQRATNPAAGDALSIMMRDLGLTGGERTSFQDRLNRVISSGHIAPDRIGLMEALATWDNAQARGSRIGFTRDEFLERYQDGWRFDESGNFRWYKLDIDRTAVRQFFTAAEMADHGLAFDRLAAPGSTSSFRKYYEMLTEVLGDEATARTRVRSRLDELLAHRRGNDLDFVRHELKITFRRDVLDYVSNRGRLATAHPGVEFREASHLEMMRLTQGLNSSDKGNLAEAWYLEVFAPGAHAHVSVVGASGTKRYPDLVNPDGVLQDLKYIEGALAARELEQFDDYRRMIGSTINVAPAGSPANNITIIRLRYSFINPRGVLANADWMARTLASSTGNIHFEIFNNRGQRRIVSSAGVFETVGDRSTRVAGLEFLSDPAALGAWLNL